MRYRVLGPVEVYDGTRSLPLGGPRRRTVLALLVLNLGQPLSVRRLTDAVWEGTPPATAHQQILISISSLRRELGDTIARVTAGYQLHAERSEVDLYAFEDGVASARRQASADERAAGLRDALRLWNGPALGGVRGLESEAARLEELRLAVLEECLATELDLGAHAERVAELSGLVTDHPLRERLRGLLMLALYRSGRQADALESYRAGREQLVGELGIEPAQPLRQLHQVGLRLPLGEPRTVQGRVRLGHARPHRRRCGRPRVADRLHDGHATGMGRRDPQARSLPRRLAHRAAARPGRLGCVRPRGRRPVPRPDRGVRAVGQRELAVPLQREHGEPARAGPASWSGEQPRRSAPPTPRRPSSRRRSASCGNRRGGRPCTSSRPAAATTPATSSA